MSDILKRLESVVADRRNADTEKSYIAKRFAQGTEKIAQKFGEEAVETVIAAVADDRQGVISESADMIFHWLLLLADSGVTIDEVLSELEKREGTSGIDEKARRSIK